MSELKSALNQAQLWLLNRAVKLLQSGADKKAIAAQLRKAGIPKELWPE